ncbi:hypothetical protein CMV_002414 [Castanea mollissima]|uniref:Uncharacterized protein n=1 Tax=Castanea mollissima TaxID=60419 RepID=A0A8J4S2B9_9ROSI|nr:hypothetical protein CMV_002414 [Castanea mollissima]
MQVEQVRQLRKSVTVIPGSSHSQAPWGRKFKYSSGSNNKQSADNILASSEHDSKGGKASTMKVDQQKFEKGAPKTGREGCPKGRVQGDRDDNEGHSVCCSSRLEKGVAGLTLKEGQNGGNSSASGLKNRLGILEECTKQSAVKSVPLRTWKKIARQCQQSDVDKQPSSMERRPEIDIEEVTLNKRLLKIDISFFHECLSVRFGWIRQKGSVVLFVVDCVFGGRRVGDFVFFLFFRLEV